ncbi:hypothetical protein JCM6882_006554 [Rhodosporidiobolus microsporus]
MCTLDERPLFSLSPSHPFPLTSPSPGSVLPSSEFPQNASDRLPLLFQPLEIKSMEFKNRIFLAPMCQYSAAIEGDDAGVANDWHKAHWMSFATRGAALVITEATSVSPEGRLSPQDLGLWNDKQCDALKPIFASLKASGARVGIQLCHAGRKSSTLPPWLSLHPADSNVATSAYGGWPDKVVGPSATPYHSETYPHPKEMTKAEIRELQEDWVSAVKRADEAGADVLELHFAHGYLIHNFLSPVSNKRTDEYGGSLESRLRLPLSLISLTRAVWPANKPLFLRISATDWHPAGEKNEQGEWISWGVEQSKILVHEAIKRGIDLVDVSSGGNDPEQQIKPGPLYQVPFASDIRKSIHADFASSVASTHASANSTSVGGAGEYPTLVSAVGLITSAEQAEGVLQQGKADVVTIGRAFLRDPSLVFNWAQDLGVAVSVPVQYQRAFTRMLKKRVPRDDQQCHLEQDGNVEVGDSKKMGEEVKK